MHNNKFLLLFTGLTFWFSSCTIAPHISAPIHVDAGFTGEGKVLTAAFQQKAAEYRALCYQAYNAAHWHLDDVLQLRTLKSPAIMTDIDETILDNSPYQVHQSLQGKDFDPASWYEWTALAEADTVPGALHFLKYAASRGVEVFYVTNRDDRERAATLKNLEKYNFPFADEAHLMTKGNNSSKVGRRNKIRESHTIVLYIGDNLNDLSGVFEKKSVKQRMESTDSLAAAFGKRYIVIPNPSYGEWENALYHYKHNLTPEQKDSIFRSILRSY